MIPNWCDDKHSGLHGCTAPVCWVIKAADMKKYACGRHLNRVCLDIVKEGAEYMTVTLHMD